MDNDTAASTPEMSDAVRAAYDRAEALTGWLARRPDPSAEDAELVAWLVEGRTLGLALLLTCPGEGRPYRRDEYPDADVAAWDYAAWVAAYRTEFGADAVVNVVAAVEPSRLAVIECRSAQAAALAEHLAVDRSTLLTLSRSGTSGSGAGSVWLVIPDGVDPPTRHKVSAGMAGDVSVWGYVECPGYAAVCEGPHVFAPDRRASRDEWAHEGAVRVYGEWITPRLGRPGAIDEPDPDAEPALYVAGVHLAELIDRPVDTRLSDLLGHKEATRVRRAHRRVLPGEDARELETARVLPVRVCGVVGVAVPSREQVAAWAVETGETDPHDLVAAWDAREAAAKEREVAAERAAERARERAEAQAAETLRLVEGGNDAPLLLPAEFWGAAPVLEHIRAAAHRAVLSPDALLAAVLARIAAYVSPDVKVDTGIRTGVPLHLFVAVVGKTGAGKSSAATYAEELMPYPVVADDLPDSPDESPPDEMLASPRPQPVSPAEYGLGTGQGVSEAYMGVRRPESGKGRGVRTQVREHVLLTLDEGGSMIGVMDQSGSILAAELRSAWSGGLKGQANGRADTTRRVTRYALGIIVSFQLPVYAGLVTEEHLQLGTPQRWLAVWGTDKSTPKDPPDDPGPLSLPVMPTGRMSLAADLQSEVRARALAIVTEDIDVPLPESQRPAMVIRIAALLHILLGRSGDVDRSDIDMADLMFERSLAVQRLASREAEHQAQVVADQRAEARRADAVSQAIEMDGRDAARSRMRERILTQIGQAGGSVVWRGRDGLLQRYASRDRRMAQVVVARLVDAGRLVDEDGTLTLVEEPREKAGTA